ncbi:M18 family aminopeptidase [Rhabdochlamydiaceae symbiont of Dictyostelium giganteum]|uniref:M18 family aminopeptidase n=1 Tax=Rhabdochlamydiaceae symbiont of Dictyostelium giganteum TaxID=3342349 RepID=UPI00384CD8A7
MSGVTDSLISLIKRSPTSWHFVQCAKEELFQYGFIPLEERRPWNLEKGKSYFVQRNGSLAFFTLPSNPSRFKILGAHTDSPALKLKPHPLISHQGYHQLLTELYGGPILSSWMNRDLGIAGKITLEKDGGAIQEELVFLKNFPCIIPQLAIHLDREVNDKGLILDKQNHLRPLLALGEEPLTLESLIQQETTFHQILAADLFLVPLEEPRVIGMHQEMLASYRLDNIASSHAILGSAKDMQHSQDLSLCFLWDHEEIGSQTTEGAGSSFANDILSRIQQAYAWSEDQFLSLKANSIALSLDVAHGLHPNHGQKSDPDHPVLLGKGIVIKHSSLKRYMTDQKALSSLLLSCQKLNVSYQHYTARSDMPGGSTIGPIFGAQMGISTVDIGIPLLSMHSTREVIALKDHAFMCQLLQHWIHT